MFWCVHHRTIEKVNVGWVLSTIRAPVRAGSLIQIRKEIPMVGGAHLTTEEPMVRRFCGIVSNHKLIPVQIHSHITSHVTPPRKKTGKRGGVDVLCGGHQTPIRGRLSGPHGGASATGLTNLLNEVAMPQPTDPACDLSTPRKCTSPGAHRPQIRFIPSP